MNKIFMMNVAAMIETKPIESVTTQMLRHIKEKGEVTGVALKKETGYYASSYLKLHIERGEVLVRKVSGGSFFYRLSENHGIDFTKAEL